METIAWGLILIGVVISVIYSIQLLVLAFRTSILWGLGYLFVPVVPFVFIIVHWSETKKPFLRSLLAIPFLIGGVVLMPDTPS